MHDLAGHLPLLVYMTSATSSDRIRAVQRHLSLLPSSCIIIHENSLAALYPMLTASDAGLRLQPQCLAHHSPLPHANAP
jgi:hypothetical protein